jgi:hypothetical protein
VKHIMWLVIPIEYVYTNGGTGLCWFWILLLQVNEKNSFDSYTTSVTRGGGTAMPIKYAYTNGGRSHLVGHYSLLW